MLLPPSGSCSAETSAAGGGLEGRGNDQHRPGLAPETEAKGTPAVGTEALHGFKGGGEIGGVHAPGVLHTPCCQKPYPPLQR